MAWAKRNGLRWSPEKSQLLRLVRQLVNAQKHAELERQKENQVITLDGTRVPGSEMAEYLGLRISTTRGVISKNTKELLTKGKAAIFLMTSEKWFSLSIPPRHMANMFATHVLSIVTYGSELLSKQERNAVVECDDELLARTFLKCILKLKSTNIAKSILNDCYCFSRSRRW